MKKFRIKRDGEKDLSFTGELVASADSQWVNGRNQNRWNEIEVYKTQAGKWVYSRQYITLWEGESGSNEAHIFDDHQGLVDHLTEGGLTELGKEILAELTKHDEAFAALSVEEIE